MGVKRRRQIIQSDDEDEPATSIPYAPITSVTLQALVEKERIVYLNDDIIGIIYRQMSPIDIHRMSLTSKYFLQRTRYYYSRQKKHTVLIADLNEYYVKKENGYDFTAESDSIEEFTSSPFNLLLRCPDIDGKSKEELISNFISDLGKPLFLITRTYRYSE